MKKVATTSSPMETLYDAVEWNEEWVSRLNRIVCYPCTGVIAVSLALSVVCRTVWLTLPGIAMILYGAAYIYFIRGRTSAAWKNWVSCHRNSNDLPRGLWRTHSGIHSVFIKRQKIFLWGTYVLSIVAYIGAFIFCEFAYPLNIALSEINPTAAMFRMIFWSVIAAILSLWISYITTHQKWVRDDARESFEREYTKLN